MQFIGQTSIKARYLVTFGAQIIKTGLSFFSGVIVARHFGPANYGDYNFLIGTFTATLVLTDMGAGTAFYTFISRKRRTQRFFAYYLSWMLFQFTVTLLLVFVLLPPNWRQGIWFQHDLLQLVLAFLAAFATQVLWNIACNMGESIRATIVVKIWDVLLALVVAITILTAVHYDLLSINFLFLVTLSEYLIISVALIYSVKDRVIAPAGKDVETFAAVFREFKIYCLPLLVYSWGSCLANFANNWFLQKYGGSIQQGYYQMADKFTIIILMITTSMLQIFWKEISEAHEQNNMERARMLFTNITNGLFFVSVVISCLLVPYSREIILLLVGRGYEQAYLTWSVLLFNPLYASLGQFIATFFFCYQPYPLFSEYLAPQAGNLFSLNLPGSGHPRSFHTGFGNWGPGAGHKDPGYQCFYYRHLPAVH